MRTLIPTRAKAVLLAVALAVPMAAQAAGPKDQVYALIAAARALGDESRAEQLEALTAAMSDEDAQRLVDGGIDQLTEAFRQLAQQRALSEQQGVPSQSRQQLMRGLTNSAGLPVGVGGLFLYVVAWNVTGLKLEEYSARHTMTWIREWWAAGHAGVPLMFRDYVVERMMGDVGWIGRVAGLQQRWDMFYRTSPDERGWPLVVGTLGDGREISLLEAGRPRASGTPRRPASVLGLDSTTRWTTYFAYLRTPGAEPARRLLPAVIGRRWASRHPDQPIEALRIVFVQDLPPATGGAPEHREAVWYEGPPQGALAEGALAATR
jgi:hypothetical protein